MKPDESYTKLQNRLAHLIEKNEHTGERTKVEKQLEKKFMAAWQFAPDRLRLGCKLGQAIRLFRTESDKCVRGFDHCSYYTGENDQRVIVTQPYDALSSEILRDLTLSKGMRPEVIEATEWAFYYPEKAGLFIVKFPAAFQKAMQDFENELQRAKKEKALKARENESHCFDVGEMV